jgi:hypothetical protein
MKKLTIWFKIFLITSALTVPVTYAVLMKERIKKNVVIDSEITYYKELQKNLATFKKEQEALIAEQSQKNKQDIENAKATFNSLAAQQSTLVRAHSQYIALGQPAGTQTTSSTSSKTSSSSSSSSSKTTTTKTVSKPKTTTTTKTS